MIRARLMDVRLHGVSAADSASSNPIVAPRYTTGTISSER
jgi:hypothetical protein